MHDMEPRDTAQFRELVCAHELLERVVIALNSTTLNDTRRIRDGQWIESQGQLTDDIRSAMGLVSNWIPCKVEGIPQCECECPDCCPEPINDLH